MHPFVLGGEQYLAVANRGDFESDDPENPMIGHDSVIYKYSGTKFDEFQRIETIDIWEWQFFNMEGYAPIIIAAQGRINYHHSFASVMYKWNGASFFKFQTFPRASAVVAFEIEGCIVNQGGVCTSVLAPYMTIRQDNEGCWRHGCIVSTYYLPEFPSGNYFYQHTGFELNVYGAGPMTYIERNNSGDVRKPRYLAIPHYKSRHGVSYETNSKIFRWDYNPQYNGRMHGWVFFADIPTTGTYDLEYFNISGGE